MKRFSLFLLALFLLVVFVDNVEARDRRRVYYYSPSYYAPYTTEYVVPSGAVRSYEYVEPAPVTRSYYYEPSTVYYPSRSYYYDRSYYSPTYQLPGGGVYYYGPGFRFGIGR